MEIVFSLILKTVLENLPKLIELFSHVGGRDAFLVAIDAGLIAARAKTDADLTAKHRAITP